MNFGHKLNYTPLSTLKRFFFKVKSFITFYLTQYHKNAFHDELFLSVYSILQIELDFPGLVKKSQPYLRLGLLN